MRIHPSELRVGDRVRLPGFWRRGVVITLPGPDEPFPRVRLRPGRKTLGIAVPVEVKRR